MPDDTTPRDPREGYQRRLRKVMGDRWEALEKPLPAEAEKAVEKLFPRNSDEWSRAVKIVQAMRVKPMSKPQFDAIVAEQQRWECTEDLTSSLLEQTVRGRDHRQAVQRVLAGTTYPDEWVSDACHWLCLVGALAKAGDLSELQSPVVWASVTETLATARLTGLPGATKLGEPIVRQGLKELEQLYVGRGGKPDKTFRATIAAACDLAGVKAAKSEPQVRDHLQNTKRKTKAQAAT